VCLLPLPTKEIILPKITREIVMDSPSLASTAIARVKSVIAKHKRDGIRLGQLVRWLNGSIDRQYVVDITEMLIENGNVIETKTTPKGGGRTSRQLWMEEFAPISVPRKYDAPARKDLSDLSPLFATSQTGAKYIYVFSCSDSGEPLCKIGVASNPQSRLKQVSTGNPHKVRLDFAMWHVNAAEIEFLAHRELGRSRRNGEWFAVPPLEAIRCVFALATRPTSVSLEGAHDPETMSRENPLEPAVLAF
jgi:hypothetical protein